LIRHQVEEEEAKRMRDGKAVGWVCGSCAIRFPTFPSFSYGDDDGGNDVLQQTLARDYYDGLSIRSER